MKHSNVHSYDTLNTSDPHDTSDVFKVSAFYMFTRLSELDALKQAILDTASIHHVKGTLLLAEEGINATVAGSPAGIDAFMAFLRSYPSFETLEDKISFTNEAPFKKMKVKLRPEIVRLDVPEADAATQAGAYVTPQEWDAILADPDIEVIDTRNEYETRIGTFKGAVLPDTKHFRDFPEWAKAWKEGRDTSKKVAMFCTGGIRCEKSTAFMKLIGFSDVVHLKGGILQYLEDTENQSNAWQGSCFVFDDRAAVGADLAPDHVPCHNCGASCSADSLKHGKVGEVYCITCAGISI